MSRPPITKRQTHRHSLRARGLWPLCAQGCAASKGGDSFNLGGGAMGFVSDHVGFRGDIRYFRQLSDPDEDNEFDVGLGDLDYWRATGGITFRW